MKRHDLARHALAVVSTLVVVAALVVLLGAGAPQASAAVTQRYCETSPITGIGAMSTTGSSIDVAGFVGPATKVTVTFNSLIYTQANGNVARLRHPGGGSVLLIDPDELTPSTNNSLWGDFTFDDASTQRLPGAPGTYRPSQPLSALAGRSPNGRWDLSLMGIDPTGQARGQMSGGWCLTFEAAPAAVPTSTSATISPSFSTYGDPVSVTPSVTGAAAGSTSPTRGTISYSLDGGAFTVPGTSAAFGTPFTLPQQAPGSHTLQLRYTDATGAFDSSTSVPLGFVVAAREPAIAARLSSLHAVSRWGWYRAPVTVTFACSGGGVPVASCSPPVTVSTEGAAQEVTGTMRTADGATDALTQQVSLDRTYPTVHAEGVRDGRTYRRAPYIRCVGADAVSGLADCRVVVRKIGRGAYRYRVVALDRAGNKARDSGLYFRR